MLQPALESLELVADRRDAAHESSRSSWWSSRRRLSSSGLLVVTSSEQRPEPAPFVPSLTATPSAPEPTELAPAPRRHRIEVLSAGSEPAEQINPVAVAMAEVGIDITDAHHKTLTTEAVQHSDAVVTMGCGDACPFYPGKRFEDWDLDDPAGQPNEAVRPLRDQIKARVQALIETLSPVTPAR